AAFAHANQPRLVGFDRHDHVGLVEMHIQHGRTIDIDFGDLRFRERGFGWWQAHKGGAGTDDSRFQEGSSIHASWDGINGVGNDKNPQAMQEGSQRSLSSYYEGRQARRSFWCGFSDERETKRRRLGRCSPGLPLFGQVCVSICDEARKGFCSSLPIPRVVSLRGERQRSSCASTYY